MYVTSPNYKGCTFVQPGVNSAPMERGQKLEVEITPEMVEAGYEVYGRHDFENSGAENFLKDVFWEMLAVSPLKLANQTDESHE